MKKSLNIGDLVSVNPKITIFWGNCNKKSYPDFKATKSPHSNDQFTSIIVGLDSSRLYVQILFNESIFWVASKSVNNIT